MANGEYCSHLGDLPPEYRETYKHTYCHGAADTLLPYVWLGLAIVAVVLLALFVMRYRARNPPPPPTPPNLDERP